MGHLLFVVLLAALIFCPHKYKVRRGVERNRVIGGVCAGLAKRGGWAPALVRWLAIIALLATGPLTLFAYIFLCFSLPAEY
jgi:phage shock protein C